MQRYLLLFLVFGWMAGLLGFMQLNHEFERIGPEAMLVTNHFTGEVKRCRVYRSGDMSCHDVDIEPRSWIFALIPFWPGREELDEDRQRKTAARETPFTETPLFKDILFHGFFAALMLGLAVYILRIGKEDGNADGGGGGGDGGGCAGE